MRKKWFLVPVVVGVIAIVSTTAIFAQTPSPNGESPKTFASRVAGILGLSETQVQSAIDQASRKMHNDATKAKLDRMVANGKLTQAQADEYLKWYEAKPEGIHGFGFGGPTGKHGQRGFGPGEHGKPMFPGSPAPTQSPSSTPSA